MSYFDSLASWQNGAEAIQSHQQAIEQEYKNSKANDIEQKFDQVDKYLQEGGGGLTGLAAGFHVSRKIYQKVKSSQAKKKELQDKANKDKEGSTDKGNELDNQGDKAPQEHNGKQNGTEGEEGGGVEEDWEDGGDFGFGDKENPNKPPETDTNDADDAPTEAAPDNAPETTPEQEEEEDADDAPAPEEEDTPAPDRPPPAEAAPEEPSLGNSGDLVDMEGGGQRIGQSAGDNVAASAEDTIKSAADGGADAAKTALSGLKESGQDALDNIATKGGDLVSNGLTKVAETGSKIAEGGTDLLTTGLDTASTVLDFLGPVGEVVGAGIMIGSFFHDLFGHKKKDKDETAAQNAGGDISQGSGISTTSMAAASVKSNVVGTLV